MEARPLAELAVPGLELLRRRRIADDRVDAGADLLHLLVIGVLERGQHALARPLLPRQRQDGCADAARQVGPAVLHQVFLAVPPAWFAVKFSSQRCCQPGEAMEENQPGSIGALARTSTDEGVRWKT